MNEHVVTLIGQSHQDFCEGHEPLPNGDCWFYTHLKCADHDAIFQRGPGIFMDFAGSPGHYILKHPGQTLPTKQDFIVVDDKQLRRMDSVEIWMKHYKDAQQKLGPALSRTEYLKQKAEFEAGPSESRLKQIAADRRAAYREEAAILLANRVGEHVAEAEKAVQEGRFGEALALLRKDRVTVRSHELTRWIEWTAAERLMEARAYAGQYKDVKSARATYEEIIEKFPGTEAQKAAHKELEAIR
jgi:hypothetical protein